MQTPAAAKQYFEYICPIRFSQQLLQLSKHRLEVERSEYLSPAVALTQAAAIVQCVFQRLNWAWSGLHPRGDLGPAHEHIQRVDTSSY